RTLIEKFSFADYTAQVQELELLAEGLSSLGFYIDEVESNSADRDKIIEPVLHKFRGEPFATTSGTVTMLTIESGLELKKREAINLFTSWQEKPEDALTREKLEHNLETIRQDADLAKNTQLQQQAAYALVLLKSDAVAEDAKLTEMMRTLSSTKMRLEAPSEHTQRMLAASEEVVDRELLQIFLYEAQDVLLTIREHFGQMAADPHNIEYLTTIRRGFHTLKGSGRMVGLKELGDVAWNIEQVMNKWLQQERSVTPQLLHLIQLAHAAFSSWIGTLQTQGRADIYAPNITALADALLHDRETAIAAATPSETVPATPTADEIIVIGATSLDPVLYQTFVDEAADHIAALKDERALLQQNPERSPSETMMRAAHTLTGISRIAGFNELAELASALEEWTMVLIEHPAGMSEMELNATVQAVAKLEQMIEAIRQRREPESAEKETQELQLLLSASITQSHPMFSTRFLQIDTASAMTPEEPAAAADAGPVEELGLTLERRTIRDDLDMQLIPIFLEEAHELVPIIGEDLRSWRVRPEDNKLPTTLARALHTLKGSARMAGAMRLGELTHNLESKVENAAQLGHPMVSLFDDLENQFDRMAAEIEKIKSGPQPEAAPAVEAAAAPAPTEATQPEPIQVQAMLRVRADIIDRLVNEAGEISIARARIEGEMRDFKQSLLELSESVARLRHQLREVEIQAETQMQSQMGQMGEEAQRFDPLEFDRFTRLQELTRLMAESVHDVITVQQTLLNNLDETDAAILQQARLNRDLQDELMRVRTIPFSSIAERLYRIVRLTAKELHKKINLEIRGSQVELDRSVLEKIVAPIEHMLRNAITHGIEEPGVRVARGKFEIGEISITLHQEANEIVIAMSDDGAGLDFEHIRLRGMDLGLLQPDDQPDEARLARLIFASGFSTAKEVTELVGRGVGLDVVDSEITGLNGRVDVASRPNQGTTFTLHLPLTLSVAQVLLVRAADRVYALPSTMVEQVREPRPDELATFQKNCELVWLGNSYPFH
ncbi:MAG: Hpt domain-containing protein, partial [Burkholderiales bacterium]